MQLVKKILLTIFIGVIGVFCGCTSVKFHSWQVDGNEKLICAASIKKNVSNWPVLDQQFYFHVANSYRDQVSKLLENQEYVPITNGDAQKWCMPFAQPQFEQLQPYLVRGVAFSCPAVTIVKYDPNTNDLLIYTDTYVGELYIPGMNYEAKPWPLVVYFTNPPAVIYPVAQAGGDAVFRGRQNADSRGLRTDPNVF
jgi:hypothetical protein